MYEFCAKAIVKGGPLAPEISGEVCFRQLEAETEVIVNISGLPPYKRSRNGKPIGPFGFHIHENGDCTVGNPGDPFLRVGGHYNPDNQPHGNHAGDLPMLYSNGGRAKMTFYTSRFRVEEVLGRAVVIHMNPDDSVTQPSGNSGKRLACGIIEEIKPVSRKIIY